MHLVRTRQAKPNADGPLPGVYKIGAWYDSADSTTCNTDTIGLPLASPLSNRMPAAHRGDFSLYAIADQMIWRSKDDASRTLERVHPSDVRAIPGSQSGQRQSQRWLRFAGAVAGARQRYIRRRNGDRMGEQRRVSATTGGCNFTSPRSTHRFAAARLSSRRAIRLRSCPRGRFSPTSSMSSIPARESPTRTIRRRGLRTSS